MPFNDKMKCETKGKIFWFFFVSKIATELSVNQIRSDQTGISVMLREAETSRRLGCLHSPTLSLRSKFGATSRPRCEGRMRPPR